VILDFGGHCRELLLCVVNPAEIEVENEKGNRMLMIFKSLAKIRRQACVMAVNQPQVKAGAFDMTVPVAALGLWWSRCSGSLTTCAACKPTP
jgi:hypothetical protein